MNLKWIEPESRLIINRIFGRDFDTFSDQAKRTINWYVLVGDALALWALFALL